MDYDDNHLVVLGTPGADDFQLLTIHSTADIGVAHSASYNTAVGMTYVGWAASDYPDLANGIYGWTDQSYSIPGEIQDLVPIVDPRFPGSPAYGPEDITSAFAFDLDPSATYASVTMALRGLPAVDGAPPEVSCEAAPAVLWSPNHEMIDVAVTIQATDDFTDLADLVLSGVTVSSDEPDDDRGDGSTTGDINGLDGFLTPVDVTDLFSWDADIESFTGVLPLRAERSGLGDGRIYTIEATVLDEAGNEGFDSWSVVVPISMMQAVPEPSTLVGLLSTAAMALVACAWRRRQQPPLPTDP